MAEKHNLPEGIHIVGRVLNSEKRSGTSKTGNPYTMLTYMVICGDKVVNVSQNDAETAPVHPNGTLIQIEITPNFRDNGVIVLSGNCLSI